MNPVQQSDKTSPRPLTNCSRRTFLNLTLKGVGALGLTPQIPLLNLTPAASAANSVAAPALTATTIASFLRAARDQKDTLSNLTELLIRPISKLSPHNDSNIEEIEFALADRILTCVDDPIRGPFTLFDDALALTHLGALADPNTFPGLSLTAEQAQVITRAHQKGEWVAQDTAGLLAQACFPSRASLALELSHCIGKQYGNIPTQEQAHAWQQYAEQRRGILELMRQSGIEKDEEFSVIAHRTCSPYSVPNSHEQTMVYLTATLIERAQRQLKITKALDSLSQNPPFQPHSFVWSALQHLTKPHARAAILQMEDVVLRGRFCASLEHAQRMEALSSHGHTYSAHDQSFQEVCKWEDALLQKKISIPRNYRGKLESLYRAEIRHNQELEYRLTKAFPCQDPLISLCESRVTAWAPSEFDSIPRGTIFDYRQSLFASISLRDSGWRASFKPCGRGF